MNKTVRVQWRYTFRLNHPPENWRERLGDLVRRIARRIDGRPSLAFDIRTEPDIGPERLAACLRKGIDRSEEFIIEELREVATEKLMRAHMPELYEKE